MSNRYCDPAASCDRPQPTERHSVHGSLETLNAVLLEAHDQLSKLLEAVSPILTPEPPSIGAAELVKQTADFVKSPLENLIDERTASALRLRDRITQALREVSL